MGFKYPGGVIDMKYTHSDPMQLRWRHFSYVTDMEF